MKYTFYTICLSFLLFFAAAGANAAATCKDAVGAILPGPCGDIYAYGVVNYPSGDAVACTISDPEASLPACKDVKCSDTKNLPSGVFPWSGGFFNGAIFGASDGSARMGPPDDVGSMTFGNWSAPEITNQCSTPDSCPGTSCNGTKSPAVSGSGITYSAGGSIYVDATNRVKGQTESAGGGGTVTVGITGCYAPDWIPTAYNVCTLNKCPPGGGCCGLPGKGKDKTCLSASDPDADKTRTCLTANIGTGTQCGGCNQDTGVSPNGCGNTCSTYTSGGVCEERGECNKSTCDLATHTCSTNTCSPSCGLAAGAGLDCNTDDGHCGGTVNCDGSSCVGGTSCAGGKTCVNGTCSGACVPSITVSPSSAVGCSGVPGSVTVNWSQTGDCAVGAVYANGVLIASGCSGSTTYSLNTPDSIPFDFQCTAPDASVVVASQNAVSVSACSGCGACSGTWPTATCNTAGCPIGNSVYNITYTGPGPVNGSNNQTWFKNASPIQGPLALGDELDFTLNFVDPFDFSPSVLCISPDNCAVLPGQTAQFTVTVHSLNGFAGTVNLSSEIPGLAYSSAWPSGSVCTLTSGSSCAKTLNITPSISAVPVDYTTFKVIGSIPASATIKSPAMTFKVWDFNFTITPPSQNGNSGSVVTYTLTSSGINGYNKALTFNGISILPATVPAPTFSGGLPQTFATPGTGTFSVNVNGTCGTVYTITVQGGTTTPVPKNRTATLSINNAAPTLSLVGSACAAGASPVRSISLSWNAFGGAATLERSTNNFATIDKTYALPGGASTCMDTDGAGGSACAAGTGLPARAANGVPYYYRLNTNACGALSTYSNVVTVPSPDCAPSVTSAPPTATITSWCSQSATPPSVLGSINWTFCDPDAPNWASCVTSQAAPAFANDTGGAFQVQIATDPSFATTPINTIVADSGVVAGSAQSWFWPTGLTYNTTYYYRVRVQDADAWGG